MSSISRELLERISEITEWTGAIFGVLAAVSVVVYVLVNKPLRKIEKQEVQIERQKTANAEKESAEAQLALKKYVDVIAKSDNPRFLDRERFVDLLKNTPKGTAEIWYEPDNEEAYSFAFQLHRWLGPEGAGWQVFGPRSFPETRGRRFPLKKLDLRAAADSSGMAIAAKTVIIPDNRVLWDLQNAINLGVGGWNIAGLEFSFPDSTLPANHFVIAIGPHHTNVALWTPNPKK